jgi:hypothetical protein
MPVMKATARLSAGRGFPLSEIQLRQKLPNWQAYVAQAAAFIVHAI